MIYMFLSNNPSSGNINLSNLPCRSYNQDHFDQHSSVMCLPNQVRQIDRCVAIIVGPIIRIIVIKGPL